VYLISRNPFQSLNFRFKDIVQKILRPSRASKPLLISRNLSLLNCLCTEEQHAFLSKQVFSHPQQKSRTRWLSSKLKSCSSSASHLSSPGSSMGSRNTSIDHSSFLPQFRHSVSVRGGPRHGLPAVALCRWCLSHSRTVPVTGRRQLLFRTKCEDLKDLAPYNSQHWLSMH
jgi:hypothetical protein